MVIPKFYDVCTTVNQLQFFVTYAYAALEILPSNMVKNYFTLTAVSNDIRWPEIIIQMYIINT